MAKKADAWQEYKEAALVDMMLKVSFWLRLLGETALIPIMGCLFNIA